MGVLRYNFVLNKPIDSKITIWAVKHYYYRRKQYGIFYPELKEKESCLAPIRLRH